MRPRHRPGQARRASSLWHSSGSHCPLPSPGSRHTSEGPVGPPRAHTAWGKTRESLTARLPKLEGPQGSFAPVLQLQPVKLRPRDRKQLYQGNSSSAPGLGSRVTNSQAVLLPWQPRASQTYVSDGAAQCRRDWDPGNSKIQVARWPQHWCLGTRAWAPHIMFPKHLLDTLCEHCSKHFLVIDSLNLHNPIGM